MFASIGTFSAIFALGRFVSGEASALQSRKRSYQLLRLWAGCFGSDDFFAAVDLPDAESAVAVAAATGSAGV